MSQKEDTKKDDGYDMTVTARVYKAEVEFLKSRGHSISKIIQKAIADAAQRELKK